MWYIDLLIFLVEYSSLIGWQKKIHILISKSEHESEPIPNSKIIETYNFFKK